MQKKLAVIIPAIKKNVAFSDDLVKKLAGKTLVLRAIDLAISVAGKESIFLVTDSEEIRLIGDRVGISVFWDRELNWERPMLKPSFLRFLRKSPGAFEHCILLSPYAPLLERACIEEAYATLIASEKKLLQPVRDERRIILNHQPRALTEYLFEGNSEVHFVEFRGFTIFSSDLLANIFSSPHVDAELFPISSDQVEISSYQDWWICEKLLQRKRIVFRVIGDEKVGMGHIYRALSLAHEITDHEIMFVCDDESALVASRLAGYDYWLASYPKKSMISKIVELKPDLVVNDIIDTDASDVSLLHQEGIHVVNFEDMGSGARLADLTINELYDEPQFEGGNVLWGHEYFFVRDEFHDARAHKFKSKVENLLLVFGGTDQLNLSKNMYDAVRDYCRGQEISIHIVTGPGYQCYEQLSSIVAQDPCARITRATGVISELMERCQIAITSNGRTVYELAHMNIPAIVIAQHDREKTHAFACPENGFLPVGVYQQGKTENQVTQALEHLVGDMDFRRQLFRMTTRFRFNRNKQKVINKILSLIKHADG